MKKIRTASKQATKKLKRTLSKLSLSRGKDDLVDLGARSVYPAEPTNLVAMDRQYVALQDDEDRGQRATEVERASAGTVPRGVSQVYHPDLQVSSAHSRRGDDEAEEAEIARRERRMRREKEERRRSERRHKKQRRGSREKRGDASLDEHHDDDQQDRRGRHYRRRSSLGSSSSDEEGRERHSRHRTRSQLSEESSDTSGEEAEERRRMKEKQKRKREREKRREQRAKDREERDRRRENLRLELESRMVQDRQPSDMSDYYTNEATAEDAIVDPPEEDDGDVNAETEVGKFPIEDVEMEDVADEAAVMSPARDRPSQPNRVEDDEED